MLKMVNWLLVGSGGREYSLAAKLANANRHVYVAPGNPMMDKLANVETVELAEMDFAGLVEFAQTHHVAWTLVGPEQPLSQGIVDAFQSAGLKIFGPRKAAAQLESSKAFAKDVMAQAGVATATYHEFTSSDEALKYLETATFPQVIKFNGLAGGKGVFIVSDLLKAQRVLNKIYADHPQGEVLIEEYLSGQEFSMIVMCNDEDVVTMPLAQDHKRLLDGDKGPNTGGMGAYSPTPQFGPDVVQTAMQQVIRPVLKEMHRRGEPFQGFLYAGLMMTSDGIKVIEFNVRMGDPETQVILPQLESDLGTVIEKLMQHESSHPIWQHGRFYLGTVLASKGYPGNHLTDLPLPDFSDLPVQLSYAGVARHGDQLVSHGGRIMMVISSADQLQMAKDTVNKAIAHRVNRRDYTFRHDIGDKAMN
jgi:phosphoribosylamine---glycine ligase